MVGTGRGGLTWACYCQSFQQRFRRRGPASPVQRQPGNGGHQERNGQRHGAEATTEAEQWRWQGDLRSAHRGHGRIGRCFSLSALQTTTDRPPSSRRLDQSLLCLHRRNAGRASALSQRTHQARHLQSRLRRPTHRTVQLESEKKRKRFSIPSCVNTFQGFFSFSQWILCHPVVPTKKQTETRHTTITKNNKQYRDKSGMFPMDHSSLREHRRRTSRGTKVPRVDCTSFRS